MEKFEFNPGSSDAWFRRIRTHVEWNVETHMDLALGPTSCTTRSRISAAALLVKVIARTCPTPTSRAASR